MHRCRRQHHCADEHTTDLRGFPRFFDDLLTPDTGVGAAPVVDVGAFEFGHRSRIRRR
jgi:hypothetical protein